MYKIRLFLIIGILVSSYALSQNKIKEQNLIINRTEYKDRLEGFWLGSCIANWTGLPTENHASDHGQYHVKIFERSGLTPGKHTIKIVGDAKPTEKTIDMLSIR